MSVSTGKQSLRSSSASWRTVGLKKVALTFDDGPNPPYTNQILDILKKENIKATFFVCGANVKRHPEILKRIARDGHLIGNHTYYHNRPKTLAGLNWNEIQETQELIDKLTSQKEKLFRPPYGHMPFWLKRKLTTTGFKIIPYLLGDYTETGKLIQSPEEIAKNVLSKVKDKSIILLHDGHNIDENADRSKTVAALPIIIKELKNQSYQFTPAII